MTDNSWDATESFNRPDTVGTNWLETDRTVAAERGESDGDIPRGIGDNPRIDPGDTYEGYIGSGDGDTIKVRLVSGVTYEMAVIGTGEGLLDDPTLNLRNGSGQQLAFNDNIREDNGAAGILFTPTTTDDYYLTVASADGGTGAYELGLLADPSGRGERENATEIPAFRRIDGFLVGDDVDWYAVEINSRLPLSYAVYGTGDAPVDNVRLSLYDENEQRLIRDESGGSNASFSYAVDEPGTYYIAVVSDDPEQAGAYSLRTMADPATEFDDPTWIIDPGFFYTGLLLNDERDLHLVELDSGVEYGFEIFGSFEFGVEDTFIEVFDRNGRRITFNDDETDDSSDSYARFTATYSGDYYIGASATEADDVGIYWIHGWDITNATPEQALTWQDATVENDPIRVFFARDGVSVNDEGRLYVSDGFSAEQQALVMEILGQVSDFADVSFEVTNRRANADFQLAVSDLDGTTRGQMNPQGRTFYSDGVGIFDNGSYWTEEMLQKGGLMNHIIAHELGHGLGLAHPHDGGGNSDQFIGVRDQSDLGDFDLNQAPFTLMTYNEYWDGPLAPERKALDKGYLFGFGALDIAVLQDVYGTNTDHAAGDDIYSMDNKTWLESIWDTGGTDAITYSGKRDVVIDLSEATLDYSESGGGAVSYVKGGRAGFTIANGVEIENASGGEGADLLRGNKLPNDLSGGAGQDTLSAGAGGDTLRGGSGSDLLWGADGDNLLMGQRGKDRMYGVDGRDTILGSFGNDRMDGGDGRDQLSGGAGRDSIEGGKGRDLLEGGAGADTLIGGPGQDTLIGGGGADHYRFFYFNDDINRVEGFTEADVVDLSGQGLSYESLEIDRSGAITKVLFGETQINFFGLDADLNEADFLF